MRDIHGEFNSRACLARESFTLVRQASLCLHLGNLSGGGAPLIGEYLDRISRNRLFLKEDFDLTRI